MRVANSESAGETDRRWQLGDEVYDSNGRKLGTVVAAETQVLTVKRGRVHTSTLYVPTCFVRAADAGQIQLHVSHDEATSAGWDRPPGRRPRPTCPPLWSDRW